MRQAAIRKGLGVLVRLAAFVSVIPLATLTTWRMDVRPRTDDAYLQADLVHMAPEVSGRIVKLPVRDNQMVHRGEVLFKIDPEPFRLRVDQAQATVRGLEARLSVTTDQVAAQTANADTANQAAINVGIAQAAYLPILTTSAIAGYQHAELASKVVHYLLYGLLIARVVLGFILRWSGNEAISFFGLQIAPPFAPFSKPAHELVGDTHNWIGWSVIILAGGHAAAGLFHYFILRDDVLWRMMPGLHVRRAEAGAPDGVVSDKPGNRG